MKPKKAQVEVQFNWIFVLIAGAIILFFFVGIVIRQKTVSETKLAGSVSEDLRAILVGAGLKPGVTNLVDIPDIDIVFNCDESDDSWFGVGIDGKVSKSTGLPIEPVFAPKLVKGRQMITWALDFNAPFAVTNLLFVTSPEIRYIFVYEDNTRADEIFEKLPDFMFKERISANQVSGLQDLNNYKIKFVIFEDDSVLSSIESLDILRENDVSVVQIMGDGNLRFWKKQGSRFVDEGSSFYIGENMDYGAIFAEDLESYECNLRKVFRRLNFVSELYSMRESAIIQKLTQERCEDYYARSISILSEKAEQCNDDLSKCSGLKPYIEDVEENNNNLELKGCPVLY